MTMTTATTVRAAFSEEMSRDGIYQAASANYLHVTDTKISEDHFILEVKEYFGHTDELGEPCDGASDDDFHVVFEYTSKDDETYYRQFEDLSIFEPERKPGPNEVECPECNHIGATRPVTADEIKALIHQRGLTLTQVIDVVCELNGFVGVGYITFGDQIGEYIKNKASKGLSAEAWLNS